jgi:hypothetical protein
MKDYTKILFSILVAAVCTVSFAADKPNAGGGVAVAGVIEN